MSEVRLASSAEGPEGAPVVVLANPIGTRRAIWDAQARVLRRRYRLLRFELRGHGAPGERSEAPPGPYSLAELGTDVLSLMRDHGVTTAAYCGVSLGGMIGLWLAAHAPERIGKLVVCCTAITPMPSRQSWLDRVALVRSGGMAAISEMVPPRWFTPDFIAREPAAVSFVMDMLLGTDPEGYAGCGEAIADMDLRPVLGSVKAPTLVIAGAEDLAAPPWQAAMTASGIAGSRLRVIRGTSHLAPYQTPGPVTDAILAHLQAPASPGKLGAMLPWFADLAGRIDEQVISSELLRGNPLGDPHERPLLVYLPPGYDDEPQRRYPAVYVIQGYTGHVAMWRNRSAYRQPFPETADAVFASGQAPPAIVVYVDAWTRYGGSQFVDSPGTGRYHSYLCDEVVPWVDARYRTLAGAEHRAIMGKSSGGFGAMITPMLRPDLFGALATHAGDTLYEYCYLPEFANAVRHLRRHDGDIWRWWEDFQSRVAFTREEDMSLLSVLGVAACFSANPDGRVDLPFDPVTGVIRQPVWQRWLDWDPVRMVPAYADALRGLRAIWIDAGTRDEYHLDLGAQAFRAALRDIGVRDDLVHFELFEAGHGAIDYRYPMSLAWLCGQITK